MPDLPKDGSQQQYKFLNLFTMSKPLNEMSISELEAHKRNLYKENNDNGNISTLYTIARMLGESVSHNYGPKYLFKLGNLVIYVDDYGGYMTVHVDGKLKVSTHNEKLYAPGEWEQILATHGKQATTTLNDRKGITESARKNELINLLS